MAESTDELKSLLVKVKEEIEKKTLNSVLKKKQKKIRLWYTVPWLHANRCGNNGKGEKLYPLGPKSSGDGDCNHEVKKLLLLGRKDMKNLDSILKSRDITLPTEFHIVKAMIFLVMYGCESWTIKKTEHWRIDAFELCCWRKLSRVSCTALDPTSKS